MIERPILFSAPMVRAIHSDAKTQTRRLVDAKFCQRRGVVNADGWRALDLERDDDRRSAPHWCPYGEPGDRLWVRETWAPVDYLADGYDRDDPVCVGYRADETARRFECPEGERGTMLDTRHWNWKLAGPQGKPGWRPSIFMPRWASRLLLNVKAARVERLHDITEEDALAEGVEPVSDPPDPYGKVRTISARRRFERLWDSINGKRAPWASNPWVWRIEFSRVAVARAA